LVKVGLLDGPGLGVLAAHALLGPDVLAEGPERSPVVVLLRREALAIAVSQNGAAARHVVAEEGGAAGGGPVAEWRQVVALLLAAEAAGDAEPETLDRCDVEILERQGEDAADGLLVGGRVAADGAAVADAVEAADLVGERPFNRSPLIWRPTSRLGARLFAIERSMKRRS
jgi:hypothetical protein